MIQFMQPVTPTDEAERKLLIRYLERKQTDLANIEQAIAQENFEEARRIGHNLAGSGSAYGFVRVSVLGREIEAAARKNAKIDILNAVRQLRQFLTTVVIGNPS